MVKIPWGGLLVGLTRGLVHMFTKWKSLIGIEGLIIGILYGVLYLVVKKNIYIAYPFILLMFVV